MSQRLHCDQCSDTVRLSYPCSRVNTPIADELLNILKVIGSVDRQKRFMVCNAIAQTAQFIQFLTDVETGLLNSLPYGQVWQNNVQIGVPQSRIK